MHLPRPVHALVLLAVAAAPALGACTYVRERRPPPDTVVVPPAPQPPPQPAPVVVVPPRAVPVAPIY
jgi:hypothetical protein